MDRGGPLRMAAERALGHPVPAVLPPEDGRPLVAGSVAGDPPRARVAWLEVAGRPLARVACPPGRPSRWRPVVASVVEVEEPGVRDRVLVARLAPEAAAARAVLAAEGDGPSAPAADGGLVLMRLPPGVVVLAVDALSAAGEPVGRLDRSGVGDLRLAAGRLGGRLPAGHGMGAGIGHGGWVHDLADAALEAGFAPRLPAWVPPGLERSRPRIEPDLAHPAAPPAVLVAWSDDESRVLLRQCVAPLASPDPGGAWASEVDVNGVPGTLRTRGLVTLVWEREDLAFGLQLRRVPGGAETALRVARSIPAGG